MKHSYQRRNRRGSGGNAREPQPWRSVFFGDGGGVADRPAVEPVGPGCGKKPFKQQAIGIGKLVGVEASALTS